MRLELNKPIKLLSHAFVVIEIASEHNKVKREKIKILEARQTVLKAIEALEFMVTRNCKNFRKCKKKVTLFVLTVEPHYVLNVMWAHGKIKNLFVTTVNKIKKK